MIRRLLVILATIAAIGALSVPAMAKAEKLTLLATPSGNCSIGATGGVATDAFAVINFTGSDTVSATVSIKDGRPDTAYTVSLVQTPSGTDCFAPEATLTTNKQGNGTVHLSEAVRPGTTGAFVLVQTTTFADLRVTEATAL
jgi:hypothetical protein